MGRESITKGSIVLGDFDVGEYIETLERENTELKAENERTTSKYEAMLKLADKEIGRLQILPLELKAENEAYKDVLEKIQYTSNDVEWIDDFIDKALKGDSNNEK